MLLDESPKDLLRNKNGILSILGRIALFKVKGDLKTPGKSSLALFTSQCLGIENHLVGRHV